MKAYKKLMLELTVEERETLIKAVDLLSACESNMENDAMNTLQEMYEESVGYIEHKNAMATTIDFLAVVLEHAEVV